MTPKPRLRLFVPDDLAPHTLIGLNADQSHYATHVMRATPGEAVILFNGRDGEWLGHIDTIGKKSVGVLIDSQTKTQTPPGDLWLLTAPLKKDCTDLVVEKAAELGVAHIVPVTTERTNTGRINADRLTARAREAAEQCERLDIPTLAPLTPLPTVLAEWPQDRVLLFCDETGGQPLPEIMRGLNQPLALLIGPEGGFSDRERTLLRTQPFVRAVSLGPLILRAETAAIAGLAIIGALKN